MLMMNRWKVPLKLLAARDKNLRLGKGKNLAYSGSALSWQGMPPVGLLLLKQVQY
jgi:hypothetical protein